jgi:hypothetical protein
VQTLPMPQFPVWLPDAVQQQAKRLWSKVSTEKDPVKARKILEQLISNPLMERVWDELYRKQPDKHEGFFNHACLTNASKAAAHREEAQELRKKGPEKNRRDAEFLEFEARLIEALPDEPTDPSWREQDCAAQLFLSRAYRAALDTEPQLVSDIQAKVGKLRKVAKALRKLAKELQSVGIGVTEIYAQQLEDVASDCDDDAKVIKPRPAIDPWLVIRKRGDTRRKTFVAKLSYATYLLFMKTLHNTIANVTNVVFSSQSTNLPGGPRRESLITGETVREMLRRNAQRIRPSFGPLIMPLFEARKKQLEAELENPRSVARRRNSR